MRAVYEACVLAIRSLCCLRAARLIDLGAATGRVAAVLAEHRPDAQIVAVDLSEEMIRAGRRALAAEHLS